MKHIIAITIFSIYFLSCKKQHSNDTVTFGACIEKVVIDSTAIRTNLIGKWAWTERYCPCCPVVKPTRSDKNVVATFNPNSTFSVIENLISIKTGKWTIQKDQHGFSITVTNQGAGDYLNGLS